MSGRKAGNSHMSSEETTTKREIFRIWELPEVLLYHIASWAAPPTERAAFLCHRIAPLSKASHKSILEEQKSSALWDLVLAGDYGVTNPEHCHTGRDRPERRSCKRLRRAPVQKVRDAHKLLRDNTEIAYFYLWELSYSANQSKNSILTKSKLCGILNEYGPNLMLNKRLSNGGTFLVEVCRAKNTTQSNVLHCVQELVDRKGAIVDLATHESVNSFLTPLCVAAVRAMPRVVEYLLSKNASTTIRSSARFRLFIKKNKYVRCSKATPLEFAQAMLESETTEGATTQDLRDLNRCIDLLTMKTALSKE